MNLYNPTSSIEVDADGTSIDTTSLNGIRTVGSWEDAIDYGNAYELSAVADGAYALASGHDMIMIANSGLTAKMKFSGFFINSSNNPILIEFWEGASWSGGDVGTPPVAINRNRESSNTSKATATLKAYYTTPIIRSGGTLLTQLTIYSGASAFNFANLANLMEKWDLKANTDYTVRLRNSAATTASVSARMLWFETSI